MSARLVFYWHNGRSLGHTSRAATIARAALERVSDARIFGLTGASRGLELLPPGMDVVKIPSFFSYDLPGGVSRQPAVAIAEPEAHHIRTSVINVFIDSFNPDALIGLRGVLGSRAETNEEFFSTDVVRHIDRTYEKVLIYTDSDVIDLEMLYEIPPVLRRKLHYTGYVARRTPLTRDEARRQIGYDDRLLIVAAFGGAQGALPLYLSLFDAVRRVVPNDATVVVPLGPYLKKRPKPTASSALHFQTGASASCRFSTISQCGCALRISSSAQPATTRLRRSWRTGQTRSSSLDRSTEANRRSMRRRSRRSRSRAICRSTRSRLAAWRK